MRKLPHNLNWGQDPAVQVYLNRKRSHSGKLDSGRSKGVGRLRTCLHGGKVPRLTEHPARRVET